MLYSQVHLYSDSISCLPKFENIDIKVVTSLEDDIFEGIRVCTNKRERLK